VCVRVCVCVCAFLCVFLCVSESKCAAVHGEEQEAVIRSAKAKAV
jgi:hypothetical protein